MKKGKITHLDFVVDKLTNSIENVKTGDSFKTDVSLLTTDEVKIITRKNSWHTREVVVDTFRLTQKLN